MRERRRGMFERLLTPAEWAMIQERRAIAAAAATGTNEGRLRGKHAKLAEIVESLG